jgi:ABC-type antimicrobial peptide transport system permease subunit
MTLLILLGITVVVALVIVLIGKGLGQPKVPKFDDVPADVQKLDTKS